MFYILSIPKFIKKNLLLQINLFCYKKHKIIKQGRYLVYVYIIHTLKTITDKITQKLADERTIKLNGKLSLSSKPNIKLTKSKHKTYFLLLRK